MTHDILRRYPGVRGDPMAMAMLCHVLRAKDHHLDAIALAQAAVDLAPRDLAVRDVARSALSGGVLNYYLEMLHDGRRNHCYALAIARAVRPGMRVLEIGTGAGLLSMMAARAGAEVVTCEGNPIVAAVAKDVIAQNGFADRIRVIAKRSTDLEIGVDLPEKPELLISELVSDTLFGERINHDLADAHKRLLAPYTRVLPPRCELRCALVDAKIGGGARPLEMVEGFDLSAFNIVTPPPSRALRANPHNATLRSDPSGAMSMDYSGPPPFGPLSQSVTLISRGGRVSAVAQWVRIDFGEGIVFENDPFDGQRSHWGSPLHPLPEPIETAAGEPVELRWRLLGHNLLLHVERGTTPRDRRQGG